MGRRTWLGIGFIYIKPEPYMLMLGNLTLRSIVSLVTNTIRVITYDMTSKISPPVLTHFGN